MGAPDPPQPPGDAFVRQRWIGPPTIEWVRDCDRIMLEHGEVTGTRTYRARHHARWRAKHLIELMVQLRMHTRWELAEHTEKTADGWTWAVRFLGRHGE